ncbi:MAG: hypothetical protein KJS92_03070 [Bacteroidetes bacterium]|nr:hypothetical protein [Bacteroidota bacterium]
MYAIRKPYTAFTYSGFVFLGLPLKAWFVIAQILGYALSKWIGIGFIGSLKKTNRLQVLLILLTVAAFPLLLLPYTGIEVQLLCMFISGFPLGLVYGVVFSWIEGRRFTEFLGAILACTFVFSSGFVKSAALFLSATMGWSEFQTPGYMALIALATAFPMAILINRTSDPDELDIQHRKLRLHADQATRKSIFKDLGFPLVLWIIAYFMLTLIRDLRDNFSAEILKEQGINDPGIFLSLEAPASLILVFLVSLTGIINRHDNAIRVINYLSMTGLLLLLVSTLSFLNGGMYATTWLFMVGLGCYVGYILLNISLFDRVISISGYNANAGFLLYIADAWGYLGSVGITVSRYLLPGPDSWTQWLGYITMASSIVGLMAFIMASFFSSEDLREKQEQLPLSATQ